MTLLYHVYVLDQKQSGVDSQLPVEEHFVKLFSDHRQSVLTSIDRGYLQVLQLHFIDNDAMEGWTV